MNPALDTAAIAHLPPGVRRPGYDRARLKTGIVHLGVGAFHRAHQALYTEEAILRRGGDWGIVGVALRHAAVPLALAGQDQLYTVEILSDTPQYRVVGVLRSSLIASTQAPRVLEALCSPQTHVVTLTITEKGYCLGLNGELDVAHPDVAWDLQHPAKPRSAIGWLAAGLTARFESHQIPVTVISCDNLKGNGARLRDAVTNFLERTNPTACAWLHKHVCFPQTVVDCIVPAATEASRARVAQALGVRDAACVQREPYSQWVIEDRFTGPRPAWQEAGVEIVPDIGDYGRLKLHVLNTCHSALAYLGLPRGHSFVREAVADAELARFLEHLVSSEIAPALSPLDAQGYWDNVRTRFQNRHIDHRLSQIAEDGAQKLAERVYPLMIANLQAAAPIRDLARIVRSWMRLTRAPLEATLEDPCVFPPGIRFSAVARGAIAASVP